MSYQPVSKGPDTPSGVTYSRVLRRVFYVGAMVMAVLPIPVVLLQLIPTYRLHVPFLVFFGPLVCLLTLAYLFYIRDALARLMFAHLVEPALSNGYYPDERDLRQRSVRATLRTTLVAALPALLILLSAFLVMSYTNRLDRSLAVASINLMLPDDVGLIEPTDKDADASRAEGASRRSRSSPRPTAPDSAAGDTVDRPTPSEARRLRVLQSASAIPDFRALTILYISPFLTALAALVLMGLREYAREALGLSERDVVLGRTIARPETG